MDKIVAIAMCLPSKIDASRFSGPEQFFAGAPYISVQKSNVGFSMPTRPMLIPRSIAVLENGRKNHSVCYTIPNFKNSTKSHELVMMLQGKNSLKQMILKFHRFRIWQIYASTVFETNFLNDL